MKTLLLILLFCSQAFGQDAVVIVQTEKGKGLATVIEREKDHKHGYIAKAVTAAHVVSDVSEISVLFSDGQRALNCQIVAVDKVNDVAIIRVWAPEKVKPIRVAISEIIKGQPVRMIGKNARAMLSSASDPTNGEILYADLKLYSGDSGGPVLNENGELVGAISGGWFWYGEVQSTWPARGSNLRPLRKLLEVK